MGGESSGIDWVEAQRFWSFQAPRSTTPPKVKNERWGVQPLDRWILARLERAGLAPAPQADKRTLLRRVTLDLTGLPPSEQELNAFLADLRPQAYERWVDRLLESRRFGERMASLWLPLARYAEDQAHQVGDDTQFFYPNAYRYREWVIQAFNRNLPYDQFIALQLAADKLEGPTSTNLAALGFLGLGPKYYNRDRLEVQADEWEDRIDTVSRTVLGLTVACARCHDHKFDPITTGDYYALAGVFASTRMVNRTLVGEKEKPDAQAAKMSTNTLHVVEDAEKPQDLPVFLRGNVDRKGPVMERRFLRVLSPADATPFKDGSGRGELATALTARSNPLTARVFVNRLWGAFFGVPLVATTSNFGHSGQAPSYPELLDDLAVRFMDQGWSVKRMVREMVLSATYRQSSMAGSASLAVDPANEKWSHMNRRRITIEQWRDSVLWVGGGLQEDGGPSLELSAPENHRRTVYGRISRLKLNDLLMQFDYPDANVHAEKRSNTTTALQKLFFLNSPFILEQSAAFASRLERERPGQREEQVRLAYRLLFSREPSREERRLATSFLSRHHGESGRLAQYAQALLVSNEMLYVD